MDRRWHQQWQNNDGYRGDDRGSYRMNNGDPRQEQGSRSWNDNHDDGSGPDSSGPPGRRERRQWNQRGDGDSQNDGPGNQGGQSQQR